MSASCRGISPRRAAKIYRIVPKSEWKGADPREGPLSVGALKGATYGRFEEVDFLFSLHWPLLRAISITRYRRLTRWALWPLLKLPRQQNLWVRIGSGNSPS
jgi:hypothetical protein